MGFDFYLASASPRRREMLSQLGYNFHAMAVDCDESLCEGETAEQAVMRLARMKAEIALAQVASAKPVLAADTLVVQGEKIFGKPIDKQDAFAMWQVLAGSVHQVLSAVVVSQHDQLESVCVSSEVCMGPMSQAQQEAYWASGEPQDKAGAYAIQGKASVFIEKINGSYSGIVGLPLLETAALLNRFGIKLWPS
ncbi:MAG: Maf family nucleotide pyrophosphatase [Gammaproteobacteria bacterium]|nr:Maf family nucleotide pyrophosphatase [Gammaproteobacteria bacterium]